MKKCTKCGIKKPFEDFAKSSRTLDSRRPWCRQCVREYDQLRYIRKGPSYFQRKNRERHKRYRKLMVEYLQKHPCENCGESNPIVLEFAHKDRTTKIDAVSMMINTYSWENILKEIKKCKVLCANCHRIETAKEFKWYEDKKEIIK